MSTLKTWIELGVSVEYDYTSPERGSRDKFGQQEEPDWLGEIEITSVMLGKLDIMESLSKDQLDSLESDIEGDISKE